jgi:hypothetical protein
MPQPLKIAVNDTAVAVALIQAPIAEAPVEAQWGIEAAIRVIEPPVGRRARDGAECARRILDYAKTAPQDHASGLIEALACVLHSDEQPAAQLIAQARAGNRACEECGEPLAPDSAPGVWLHDPEQLGDRAWDLNEHHAARPPEDAPHLAE